MQPWGSPHCCPHLSWQSPAPAEVLAAQGFGEGPKITGLPLTHERTQGLGSAHCQCKLRCAKASRITQCHLLLLHREKGQLALGVTGNHHGTTHSSDTGGTRSDNAPGGAGSTGRKRCCPFPVGDKHRQDLCFSSALRLCHPPSSGWRAGAGLCWPAGSPLCCCPLPQCHPAGDLTGSSATTALPHT